MVPENWMQSCRLDAAVERTRLRRVRLLLMAAVLSLLCCGVEAQLITEYSTGSPTIFPQGITRGPDGNLWFTGSDASDTGWIGRINPTTLAITYFGTGISPGFRPVGITVGADHNLWFTEYFGASTLGGSKIGRIDPNTGVITEYTSAGLAATGYVHGIASGADGNLWFPETFGDKIGSINPTTGVITEYSTGLTAGSQPWGITAGIDGNLWFTEFKGRIGKIDPATGTITEFTSGIQTGAILQEIVSGPDGNLWFTDSSDHLNGVHAIGKTDPATGISIEYSLAGLVDPRGITVGADLNLWFTEGSGNKIGRINPTTSAVTLYGTGISPNSSLQRIAAGPDGNLWFAEYVGRIGRLALAPSPAFVGAVSRRVHGLAGTFDLPLSTVVPPAINHNPTTEPRQGPAQTIVFTFDKPLNAATVTITEGVATAAAPTFTGSNVVAALTGVADQQYVTISLGNVESTDGGTGGSGSVRIGFLGGDVNGNRVVTLSDLLSVNNVLTQTVGPTNFLRDANVSGTLTLSDVLLVNSRLTQSLPPP